MLTSMRRTMKSVWAFGILAFIFGCPPPVGETASSSDGVSEQDLPAACSSSEVAFEGLDDGAFWTLNTDPIVPSDVAITITGRGETVEAIALFSRDGGCSGVLGDRSLGLTGNTFRLDGTLEEGPSDGDFFPGPFGPDVGETAGCSIQLTGTIGDCGNSSALIPGLGTSVFGVESQGEVVMDGQAFSITPLDLSIIRGPSMVECQDSPTSLNAEEWRLSATNPTELGPVDRSSLFVNITGSGEVVQSAEIHRASELVDVGDAPFSPAFFCTGNDPQGSIDFDGERFRVDLQLVGDEMLPPELGSVAPCSLTFDGRVAECLEPEQPAPFGGPAGQTLTIEGSGSYVSGDYRGEFATLYLSVGGQGMGGLPLKLGT